MPLECLPVYASRYILEPDSPIIWSRYKRVAIRRERYYFNLIDMPLKRLPVHAGRRIPEPDSLIAWNRR